jgi:iron-sulfur cluster repair protein YtfE (RIC family)
MSFHQEAENILNKNKSGLTDFIYRFSEALAPKKTLVLHLSGLNMFRQIEFEQAVSIEKEEQLSMDSGHYDFIVADLPLNIKKVKSALNPEEKVNNNWDLLYKAIQKLSHNGIAVFVVEPAILFSKLGLKVLARLEKDGFVYSAAFNTPENILDPITTFRPIILVFSTEPSKSIFIGTIGEDNHMLVQNFLQQKDSENLESGKLLAKSEFKSFSGYATSSQIEKLLQQYTGYQLYRLKDVSHKIAKTKERFANVPNTFYLSRVGASNAIMELKPSDDHKYFFQIQLNEELVLAEYMILFYQSKLGRLILESLNSGSFIPHITKSDLSKSTVAIPEKEEQETLVQASSKLNNLQDILRKLQQEIGLNPKNVATIIEQYNAIQGPLKSLSEEDEILELIRKGEGKHIEFKQTFSKNIVTNKKDNNIEKASLKTLVGFLNTQGGTLLVGVSDKGEVIGIEADSFNSKDSYLLHFRNTINTRIGAEYYPHIDYEIVDIMGKMVLKVFCRPSSKPCFYEKKEFFVRTNPATDKLEGQQLIEYINQHF